MSHSDQEIAEALQEYFDNQIRQRRRFIRPRISVDLQNQSFGRRFRQQFEDVKVVTDSYTLTNLICKNFCAKTDKYTECTICIYDFEHNEKIKQLPCGHLFHPDCIDNWLGNYSYKCPTCKKEIGNPTPLI
jgi:hypothetical protein